MAEVLGSKYCQRKKPTLPSEMPTSELEVEGESVPFVFDLKHGGQELRPAPLAFVTDIKSMIFHLLHEKEVRINLYAIIVHIHVTYITSCM